METVFSKRELAIAELMTFKIIDAKYVNSTISSGNIYFGCAEYYAYQEKTTGCKGKGDSDEGLYARVLKTNKDYILEQERKHGTDLIKIENGDFWDLKLRSVINLPIYCTYTMNTSDPEVSYTDKPNKSLSEKIRTYKFPISKTVLQDFTMDEVGIINFLSHSDLSNLINTSLQKMSCNGLIKNRIKYVDRNNKEWRMENHPLELFYKDTTFSYQKEGRYIITDRKLSLEDISIINNKYCALKIGNLEKIVKSIPNTNLQIELTSTIKM